MLKFNTFLHKYLLQVIFLLTYFCVYRYYLFHVFMVFIYIYKSLSNLITNSVSGKKLGSTTILRIQGHYR